MPGQGQHRPTYSPASPLLAFSQTGLPVGYRMHQRYLVRVCAMDWFKVWPSQYLNVINRIPDGIQRGAFSLLLLHCLNEDGLPNNDEEISYNTGLPVEVITSLRPHLKRLATIEGDRIMINLAAETIQERQEFSAKKAASGQKGGLSRQTKPQAEETTPKQSQTGEAKPSPAPSDQAVLSSAKQKEASLSQTDRHADMQTDMQTAAAARAEFPDDPPDEPATAQTTEIEKISNQLAKLYGLKTSGGWVLQGQFQTAAIELHSQEATAEQIEAFWHWRQKKPDIKYFAGDFLTWRASQNGKTAQANLREDLAERARQGLETLKQEDERRARRRLSAVS